MDFNFLSGATIDFDRQLFFDAMKSEQVFFGFTKKSPVWGQAALIKLSHNVVKKFPQDIMGFEYDTQPEKKYYDKNSSKVVSTIPSGGSRVFIAKIPKYLGRSLYINDFIFLEEEQVGQIYMDYMNSNWTQVQGLNPLFKFIDVDDFDYYLFNYNKDLDTAAKIEETKTENYASITTSVKLAYSIGDIEMYQPTSILQEAGDLSRKVNVNGEIVVSGMNPDFDPKPIKNAWFFLIDEDGVVVQDRMRFVDYISTNDSKILVLEYPTIIGNAMMKITTGDGIFKSLSIFKESLPVHSLATPVADNNPPALDISYLKEPMIYKSLFDILGIQKISQNEVKFCRQVLSVDDENNLLAAGFEIEELEMQSDSPVVVKYAKTDDKALALQYGCDSAMIDKNINNIDPTQEIYRQIFVSYQPRDQYTQKCAASNYTQADLFNLNTYEFDMGSLVYIANKIPVYRKYIEGNETFKIIL